MYNYYAHNPYKYDRQIVEGLNQFDFSQPQGLTDAQKQHPVNTFFDNPQNRMATANLGLGLLSTYGNNLEYERAYKDNMRRPPDLYTPIPYDRNSYNSYASDFYQAYESGGEVGNQSDLWNHSDYSFFGDEDPLSFVDEMFKDVEEPQDQYPTFTPEMERYIPKALDKTTNVVDYAHNYYTSKGVPDHVSAAIIGNLRQESQLNPMAVGDNGTAHGIAQWRGPRLKELHARYGPNPTLDQQLDFVITEPKESKVIQDMYGMSAEEGAVYFAKKYERPNPKYAHYDKRQQYAKQLYSGKP